MQDDFPEVMNHTRVEPYGPLIITRDTRQYGKQQGLFADNSFLAMFSYPLIAGDQNRALLEPHTAVLTEDAATKYFGVREDEVGSVLGKTFILADDTIPYKVTGISRNVPENSHLEFDVLLSYVTLYTGKNPWKESDYDFTDSDFWHYIQLRHGTDYKAFETKLAAFSEKHFQGNKISGSVEKFYLQPLSRAHLYSDFEYETGKTGSATVVWGLAIIALFIIVIAWVNYINLATARSIERAKEVGVRKVIGAAKAQLVKQFLNSLVGHSLNFSYLLVKSLGGYSVTIGLSGLLLLGIFISAFYPAFILSSFRPILVLKGRFSTSKKGIVLRKTLVVGQFAITIALIIGSFVVYRQIRFMNRQELGVNINQVLVISAPGLTNGDSSFMTRENSFFQQIRQIPGVAGVAASWNAIGGETGRSFNIRRADQDNTVHFTMRHNGISPGWLDLYQLKILAGRDFVYTDFNPDFGKRHNIIVNESATKLLGFRDPEEAIGKTILRGTRRWEVIGVINDYHQKSLRYPIEPTLLMPAFDNGSNIFDYYFLDQRYNEQYANDQLFGKAFGIFAGFAIFIACLGLLGLSLFATAQRTKEIGVRKVLGASVGNIVLLLSKDFILLVIIAFIIASPIAWFIMLQWLRDFAYRIDIEWWIFIVSGALAAAIAVITIGFQAMKAAAANPVRSLRSE